MGRVNQYLATQKRMTALSHFWQKGNVKMIGIIRTATTIAAAIMLNIPFLCCAQGNQEGPSATERRANEDSTAAADKKNTAHSVSSASLEQKPTVYEEAEGLKKK